MIPRKIGIPGHSRSQQSNHARIVSLPDGSQCLDTIQLNRLEQSFRRWVTESPRPDIQLSRRRILLIFLLIRYTGAKLNEVLSLNPGRDLDFKNHRVFFGRAEKRNGRTAREVQMPEVLTREIRSSLEDPSAKKYLATFFRVDPGHIRRKFYERALDSGLRPSMGSPESIRRSRAIELMQSNMPLPVVQKILGHSTLNMTASYVAFSDSDMRQVAQHFVEKESQRKTSARNSFFGKITSVQKGDIQSKVEMTTLAGDTVTTVITNNSLLRLGLKKGSLLTAEIKAPWVIIQKSDRKPESTAENCFSGTITRITKGKITSEYVVSIPDGTELCSIVNSESANRIGFQKDDRVWVTFNSFSVVLHTD